MDRETIAAYDAEASSFAKEWVAREPPTQRHVATTTKVRSGLLTHAVSCIRRKSEDTAVEGSHRDHLFSALHSPH